MRKLCAVLGIALAISVLAGSSHALSGPTDGGYLWMTDIQRVATDNTTAREYIDILLKGFKIGSDFKAVPGSFVTFDPIIPDNYYAYGSYQYAAGEYCGIPSIYESSTTDGYGKLLIGVYVDNDPVASVPTDQTMDVLRLEPQSDCSLSMVNVYGGKADVSGEFHTQDASQILYDKDGLFTSTPNSIIVTGELSNMSSRSEGYATDVDDDGTFDGVGDNDTYVGLSNLRNKKLLYENSLYSVGYMSPGAGLQRTYLADNGEYVYNELYRDTLSTVKLSGSGRQSGVNMAVGDVDGNGIPDIFAGTSRTVAYDHDDNVETAAKMLYGIQRFQDLNADGDVSDNGESGIWFITGHQNTWKSPYFLDEPTRIWEPNSGSSPIGIVDDNEGGKVLLIQNGGHWSYGVTIIAMGIADNGEFSGDYQVVATQAGSGDWEKFASLSGVDTYTFDGIVTPSGPIPGDSNGDGKIDGGDLAIWQQNYDPLGTGNNTFALGDWNNDGKIDGGDLALWQQNYDPIGPTGADGMGANVPEPATLLLLGTGLAGACGIFRRRRMK